MLETDVVVIGAGVIGMMVARELLQSGKRVIICEKNAQAVSEASYAGGGIISPLHPWRYSQPMLDLAAWSHEHYPFLIDELTRSTGIYVPLNKTGMLIPDVSEKEAALACRFLKAHIIDSKQAFDIEPGLVSVEEAIWVPDVRNVRNPSLCAALIRDVERKSIRVLRQQPVLSLLESDGKIAGVKTTDYQINAEQTVITAGAWSQQFLSDDEQKVFPVKGQMIAFKARPGVLRSVNLKDHHYLIPRHDGVILAGSTTEYSEFDKHLTDQAFQQLYSFAIDLLPALKYYPIRWHWSGLRPGNKRDTPYIGQVPDRDNLYICAGHYRNGLLSAPASARLISQIMLNKKPIVDVQQFEF